MIKGFLDESGTHWPGRFCVAGCAGDLNEWTLFEKEWSEILKYKKIPFFHAKERESESLKSFLVDILKRKNLLKIIFSVNNKDYKEGFNHKFKSVLGNAYAACTYLSVLKICEEVKKINRFEKVSIAIEDGQLNIKHIEESLKKAMNDWGSMDKNKAELVEVSIIKKYTHLSLDVADFLAHSCSTQNKWFDLLLQNNNIFYHHITKEEIKELSELKDISEIIRKRRFYNGKC